MTGLNENNITSAGSGLAKDGLMCFVETFVQSPAFVLRMDFRTKSLALRQAANRMRNPMII